MHIINNSRAPNNNRNTARIVSNAVQYWISLGSGSGVSTWGLSCSNGELVCILDLNGSERNDSWTSAIFSLYTDSESRSATSFFPSCRKRSANWWKDWRFPSWVFQCSRRRKQETPLGSAVPDVRNAWLSTLNLGKGRDS